MNRQLFVICIVGLVTVVGFTSTVSAGTIAEAGCSVNRVYDTNPSGDCGVDDVGVHYAAVGTFEDNGTRLDDPIPWSFSNSDGSIEAWAEAEAYYGSLKCQTYNKFSKDVTGRVSYRSSALAQYSQSITVENPGFWASCSGEVYTYLYFDVEGAVVKTGSMYPAFVLEVYNHQANEDAGGEGPGWEQPYGDEPAAGDYSDNAAYDVFDYGGETIDLDIRLRMSNRSPIMDTTGSGECTMDFWGTVTFAGGGVYYRDNDAAAVTFDNDGIITGGSEEGFDVTVTEPVPEPTMVSLLLLGGGVTAILRRRRR